MNKSNKKVRTDTHRMIAHDINNSTIPEELRAAYVLANALMLLTENSFSRIRSVYSKHGMIAKGNDLLKGLNEFCKAVKRASWLFFERIEPQIQGATFGVGRTVEEGVEVYDNFSEESNELCRLFLLYIDRTKDNERWRDVFTLLRRMPSVGVFKDEDFTRFKMKRSETKQH